MENNYFFVDGSSLLSDLKRMHQEDGTLKGRRLSVTTFVEKFTRGHEFQQYHGGIYRRFVFYFVDGDDRLERELILPDTSVPGAVEDLRIEHCGKSIKEFRVAQEWLEKNKAPQSVADCLYRAEKAVDTQICADALQLAAVGKLDRLFLYTNDYDFVPLCRALRHLGLNINLFRIRAFSVNKQLAQECDALQEMPVGDIQSCFLPLPTQAPTQ
ncbi:MAG TPA: NYN domain-containing protein [bacterium]|nr:NYN domain-containing protein [bacterium]